MKMKRFLSILLSLCMLMANLSVSTALSEDLVIAAQLAEMGIDVEFVPEAALETQEPAQEEPEEAVLPEETIEDDVVISAIQEAVVFDEEEEIVLEEEELPAEEPVVEDAEASDPEFVIDGAVLKAYVGTESTVVLPDAVLVVGENAFSGLDGVEHVVLPESVEVIEAYAFAECAGLKSVTGGSLKAIGDYAFWNCASLDVSFADGVEAVSATAFIGCAIEEDEAEAPALESMETAELYAGESAVESTENAVEADDVVAGPVVGEDSSSDGAVEANWKDAPQVSVTSENAGEVVISWVPAVAVDIYRVAEVVNGSLKAITTIEDGSTSLTLSGVEAGTHTYAVQPRQIVDGVTQYGNYSEHVSVDVAAAEGNWKDLVSVNAVSENANEVVISWEPTVAVDVYRVFRILNDKSYYVTDVTDGSTSVTLTNVKAGEYTYAVQPRKLVDGALQYGNMSAGVDVVVKAAEANWKDAPKLSVTSKNPNEVVISWVPAVAVDIYRVAEVVEGSLKSITTIEDGSTSLTLSDVEAGTHTYAVQPRKVVDGTTQYGTYSAYVSVEVKNKEISWKDAPQVSVTSETAGEVVISWVPAVAVDIYRVAEVVNGSLKAITTIEDGSTSLTLSGVEAGTHTYAVQPRQIVDGVTQYGNYSEYVSVDVAAAEANWKDLVSVNAVSENANEVVISWEPVVAVDVYRVFRILNDKSYYVTDVTDGTNTVTLTNVKAGEYTYAVQPRKLVDGALQYGNMSAGVDVVVKAAEANWKDAPKVTVTSKNPNEVVISWTPAVAVEIYRVAEVVEGSLKSITTIEDGSTSLTLSDVEAGTHTYAVQPRQIVDGTTQYGTYSAYVSVEVKNKEISWKDAPQVSVTSETAGEVVISWVPAVAVDIYRVAEVVNGSLKSITTIEDGSTSLTLSGVEAGTHTYAVQPRQIVDGVTQYGNYSEHVSVDVAAAEGNWKDLVSVNAVSENANEVVISWEPVVAVDVYRVFRILNDKSYYVTDVTDGTNTVTLTNVKAGEYTYAVQPRKLVDGALQYGNMSAGVDVVVKAAEANWKDAPKVTVTSKNPNEVVISWTPAVAVDIYRVAEVVEGSLKSITTIEDGSTSLTLSDVEAGTHTYAVQPRKVVDGTTQYGTYSAYVSVEVKNKEINWKDAPQVSVTSETAGEVVISWVPAVAVDIYRVVELVNGSMKTVTTIEDGSTSLTLSGVEAGTHTYAVQPRMVVDGVTQYGTYSEYLSVDVEAAEANWKDLVSVSAVSENGNEVVISWEPTVAVDVYRVFRILNDKSYYVTDVTDGSTSVTLTNVKAGEYTYAVQPRRLVDGALQYGNISEGVNVTVVDKPAYTFTTAVNGYGNLTITGYEGELPAELVIPAEIDGMKVGEIGENAFMSCTNLTSVRIEDGVEIIGLRSFYGCSKLESIDLPESMWALGGEVFAECSALKSIDLPAAVTTIPFGAFWMCSSLESIGISEDLTAIGSYAFMECSSLKSISIPAGVTAISSQAFEGCSSLTSFVVPANVTTIGNMAFQFCENLESITIPMSVETIGAAAFRFCSKLNNVGLPANLSVLEWETFHGCSSLTEINIPDGVTSIGDMAFLECSNLVSVVIPASVESISEASVFTDCSADLVLTVDYDSYAHNFYKDSGIALNVLNAPAEFELVTEENEDGTLTITGHTGDTPAELVVPGEIDGKTVSMIGHGAFEDSFELESVVISEGIKTVGYRAFAGCEILKTVSLPASVEMLHSELFSGSLETIILAEGNEHFCLVDGVLYTADMKEIAVYPGSKTDSEYVIPDGVESVDISCPHLTNVTVPASVKNLGVFGGSNLVVTIYGTDTEIDWIDGENVTIRGYAGSTAQAFAEENGYAFEALESEATNTFTTSENEDGSLTITGFDGEIPAELEIPTEIDGKAVTGIADRAFADRHGLKKITLHASLTSIGEDVFANVGVTVYVPVGSVALEAARAQNWDYIPVGKAEVNSFYYHDLDDGTICVEGANWEELVGDLEIPAEIDGKTVTRICGYAFGGLDITSVTIPGTVKVIERYAFEENSKLASITLNAGLEEIQDHAFAGCNRLTEVVIPEGVVILQDCAFENCRNLTLLDMPGSLEYIGSNLVNGCPRVAFKVVEGDSEAKSYAIANNIPYDDGNGFPLKVMEVYEVDQRYGVGVGETVTWGSYVIGGDGEYQYQYRLNRFGEEVFTTDWVDDATYSYEFETNGEYMMSVNVKSGDEETGFVDCEDTVIVGSFDVDSGYSINILSETEAEIVGADHDRFSGDITLPQKVAGYNIVGLNRGVFSGDRDIYSVIIPEGYSYIGNHAFDCAYELTSVTLPESLNRIDDYAFRGCTAMRTINLPDGLTMLGEGAFSGCNDLQSISIPAGVKNIRSWTFSNCWSLKSVTIAEGVETIGEYAFEAIDGMKSITIPSTVYDIGGWAFEGCYSLETVDMSASKVTELHNYVFNKCEVLREVKLPAGLTALGTGVFEECPNLSDIDLPDNLNFLGEGVFGNCHGLNEIRIPAGVTRIGRAAFDSCGNLTDVIFEGDITHIEDRAFNRCHSLRSITIPDTIQWIGEFAFEQCHNLGELEIPDVEMGFGRHVFMDSNVTLIVVRDSIAYHYAREYDYNYLPIGEAANYGFHYEDEGENSIIITGWYGDIEGSINIPGEIDGKTVTGIGDGAFEWTRTLSGVTLPDSVNTIGEYAFRGTGLNFVNFGSESELYLIGAGAFEDTRLTEVTLPGGVGDIGDGAFANCPKLTKLHLPAGVEYFGTNPIDGSPLCVLYVEEGSAAEAYAIDNELPYNNGTHAHYGVMRVDAYRWCGDVYDFSVWQAQVVEPDEDYQIQYQIYRYDEPYGEPSEWTTDLRYTYDFSETLETGRYTMGARMRLVSDPENTVTDYCISEDAMEVSDTSSDTSFRYMVVGEEEGNISVAITGYSEEELPENLVIPATISLRMDDEENSEVANVTAIAQNAFSGRGGVKTVEIADSVVSIQNDAFNNCWDLERVKLPANLMYLMDRAFYQCNSLGAITIPGTIVEFGREIFVNCQNLETVTFQQGLTFLGREMFANDRALKTVNLPSTLESTGDFVFADCTSLQNITLPQNLKTINDYTFAGCCALTQIAIPGTVETIGQSAFFASGLTSVVIPNSVTEIGPIAFDSCYELQSVTLSNSLTELKNYTFANCHSLNNVVVPEGVTSLGVAVFAENYSLNSITLPESLTGIGRDCFFKCHSLGEIEISANVDYFGDNIFGDTNVTIITTVDAPVCDYADEWGVSCKAYGTASTEQLRFELNYENMTATVTGYGPVHEDQEYIPLRGTLTIPGTVTDEESNTFTVTAIGAHALEGFNSLTGVKIADSVQNIGEWAFAGNNNLEVLQLPANLKRIEVDAFNSCHSLTCVEIPDGCEFLGGGAFAFCYSLREIHIPDSVSREGFHDDHLLDGSDLAVVYCNPGSEAEAFAIRVGKPYNNGIVNTLAIQRIDVTRWANNVGETGGWKVFANGDNLEYRFELHRNDEVIYDERDWSEDNTFSYTFEESGVYSIMVRVRNSSDPEIEDCREWLETMNVAMNAEDESGWRYVLYDPDEEGNVKIGVTGYDGELGEDNTLTIPATIDGHVVDSILNSAFQGRGEISHVVLNDTIVLIEPYAFQNCNSLQSFDFAGSQVNYIGEGAFENCHSLEGINLPSSLEAIECGAFKNSGLRSIKLPANLTCLGDDAFANCGNLNSVNMDACTQLYGIGAAAFVNCHSLNSITIPEGVNEIGNDAFNTSGLQSVTLPSTLKVLGDWAFNSCYGLVDVNLEDTKLTTIGKGAFSNCGSLKSIELPDTVTTVDSNMFSNCHHLERAVLSDGMKNLGWSIFENCHRLENVVLPANLETIANYAFQNCHSLSNVTIPETVYGIGERAFAHCGSLGDLVIPDSVTVFEGGIFDGAEVTLVVNYDSAAYHYARNNELDYLVIGAEADENRLNYYYEEDEYGNPYLVVNGYEGELEGVLDIPAQLPWGDDMLDVGIIDWNAFEGQERLTKVIIPGTVFVIGSWAFNDCRNLQEVELNEGLVEIYDHAFKNCERLTKVVVPDGVKYIGYNAFCNNPMLEELHLPASVEKMDDSLIEGSEICVLYVEEGSYAESYAIAKELTYDNGVIHPFAVMDVYQISWTDVVGDTSKWGAHVVGGTAPYEYNYVLYTGDEVYKDLGWSDEATVTYRYEDGGDYTMALRVKDSTGAETELCFCDEVNIIGWHEDESGFRYNYVGENEVKITSYGGEETNHLVVPDMIGEATVVGIADNAFAFRDEFETVELPSTIRFIGNHAFQFCHNLRSINLEETEITEIGERAFEGCNNLENVSLPETLVHLREVAFGSCTRLQGITIPASVESIGDACFEGCEEMTSFTFETTKLTEIDSGVFAGCSSLIEIAIPEGVKLIRERAFQDTGLEKVTLPSTLEELEWEAFADCCDLTSINLEDTALTTIGEYAFSHCCSLTSIELPDTVVTIDGYMFAECYALETAVLSDGQKYLGWGAFENCGSLRSVTLPANLETIANYAFRNCHRLSNVTIPETVYGIGERAFENCGSLGDLVIPDSVTVFEGNIFDGAEVTLIVNYDSAAYHYARNNELDYLVIGAEAEWERLNYYYEEDEHGNPYLVVNGYDGELEGELNIPAQLPWDGGWLDVGVIDWSAFQGQNRLTKVTIPGTVFMICGWAFEGCRNLQELVLNEGLREIYEHAFMNCERLTKVVVPEGVTDIGYNAFANCANLLELHLPESFTNEDVPFEGFFMVEGSKRCVLHVVKGSFAETYAIAYGLAYDNGEEHPFRVMEVYGLHWTDVVGDESSWGAYVVGGEAPLQYHYVLERGMDEVVKDFGWSDEPTVAYTYEEGGDYRMTLQVKDSTGAETDFCSCDEVNIIGWEDEETRLRYNFVGENEIKITSYGDENNHVVIPQMIGENTVVGIAANAFAHRDYIESVELPSTIEWIGDYAFAHCYNLRSINLEETQITEIGERAFECVGNLESIALPETLEWIEDAAFNSCGSLNGITIPANVYYIGASCFEGCESLAYVNLDNTTELTVIKDGSFRGCKSLTEINLPEGVNIIFAEAFYDSGLQKVTLPSTLEYIHDSAFEECCDLTSINLEDTALTTIGEYAFAHCCSLKSIELPDTVVTIDRAMFAECYSLETAVLSDGMKYLGWSIFEECGNLRSVTLPANLESIANYAFKNCHSLESLEIPASVYGIGEFAFECCCNLGELTLGKNITHLEDNIFEGCWATLNVYNNTAALDYAREYGMAYYILDAEEIENVEFYYDFFDTTAGIIGYEGEMTGHLVIPEKAYDDEGNEYTVTLINDWVFHGCDEVMSVTIPASITSIGDGAFAGCWRMKTVTIEEGSQLEEIWNNAFQECNMLQSINLENATMLTTLGDRVFQNCHNLFDVTLPASLTQIGEEINDDAPLMRFHVTAGTHAEQYCIDNGLAYNDGDGFKLCIQCVSVIEDVWNIGDTATWRAFTVGGENATYKYTLYRAGEKYFETDYIDSDTFSYRLTENGAYILGVTARSEDGEGNVTYFPLDEEGNPYRKYADRLVYINSMHESGYLFTMMENNSDDDGTYEVIITGCDEEIISGDVTIPDTLTIGEIEYAVVGIGDEAFIHNGSITKLTVPESVRDIGHAAFEHMYNMKSAILPSGLNELPNRLFAGCDQMESVSIPNVDTIPWECFRDCESLQTIELPANLKGIEGFAFYNCQSLVIDEIPDGVEYIDQYAFEACYSLGRLTIPDSVGDFGENVFMDTDVTIVANVDSEAAYYAMDNGLNLDAQGTMDQAKYYWAQGDAPLTAVITGYEGYPHGHMDIPETVTWEGNTYTVIGVDAYTFQGAEYINELTIPATMEYIDEAAFANCIRLRTMNIEGNKLERIGHAAFADCWELNDFTIPASLTEIGEEAFYNDRGLRELTIPATVTTIGEMAFGSCPRLSLKVTAGSAAETYAINNGMAYDCDGAGYNLTLQLVELDRYAFELDETAEWVIHAVGGSGEKQYQYQLFRNGEAYTEVSEWTSEASFSYKFTETGDYLLKARVQDAAQQPTGYLDSEEIVTIKNWDNETHYAYAIVGENSVRIIHPDWNFVESEMTVPAQLEGKPVTQIGEGAFGWDDRIEVINLPETIEWIGNFAFAGSINLRSINLPGSLKTIGEGAFGDCHALETIELPEGLTSIGHGAFSYSGLTEVAIPASVEEMANFVFANCEQLVTATLPEGMEIIPIDTFAECYSLANVTIPSTVKEISNGAFVACGSLTEIDIPASVIRIGDQAFRYCVGLKTVTLHDGLEHIGTQGFYNCRELESIELPETVKKVKAYAFSGCTKLSNVKLSTKMDYLANGLFEDCSALTSIDLHEGIWSIGTDTFFNCSGLGNVELPSTLTSIEQSAFYGCRSMTEVVIPDGVNDLGPAAFGNCFALESVTLPGSITKLNNFTFVNCSSLKSIIVPEGVTVIGDAVFAECYDLASVTLPESLTSIGDLCFYKCGSLTEMTIPAGVATFGEEIFVETSEDFVLYLTSGSAAVDYAEANGIAYLLDGLMKSGEFLYMLNSEEDGVILAGYTGTETSVVVPETIKELAVVEIGDGAFEGNATMEAIDLPDTVEVIGVRAFADCSSLANMT